MLDLDARWLAGRRLAAQRLHFLRDSVPVFVFGDAQFQGRYDVLRPRDIPALWDARVRLPCNGVTVLATPLEWELLLAVVLDNADRAGEIARVLRGRGWGRTPAHAAHPRGARPRRDRGGGVAAAGERRSELGGGRPPRPGGACGRRGR